MNGQTLKSQFDIEKGVPFKLKSGSIHTGIFPTENGDFYAFETISRTKVKLVHFDKNLEKKNENEVEFKFADGRHNYEGAFLANGKLYLLTSNEDTKSKLNQLYLRTINTKTLAINNDKKIISSIDYEGNWKKNSGTFEIHMSNDSSKLGIFNLSPYSKKEVINYSMTILDIKNDLEVLWSKNFSSKSVNELSDLKKTRVSNLGEAIFLFKNYKDKRKEMVNRNPNYSYELQYVDKRGENPLRYPIKLESDFISNMQIGFNMNDEIIATGFYSTSGKGQINGSYYLLIDKSTKAVKKESKKEFGIDFLTDFMKERQAKKAVKREEKGKDNGFVNFKLDEIIFRSDGGVIQIAEQFYITEHTYTDANGNIRTTIKYHYNTIIVISISPDGKIEWARKIPKRQSSSSTWYSSYSSHVVNNNIYFFYIDNPKNLVAEDYGDMKGWTIKKSVLVAVEINSEGYSNKAGIIDSKDDKMVFMVTKMVKNSDGHIIAFAKYNKQALYYRLKIKD